MQVTIQAGAKFDVVTPDELDQRIAAVSKSWMQELGRGIKFRDITAQTLSAAGATWTLGGQPPAGSTQQATDRIGPNPGFVWDVRRLTVSGGAIVLGTDAYSVYKGDTATPAMLQLSGRTRETLLDKQLILTEAEQLFLTGARTGAGADVTLTAAVIELPTQLAWQLL